MSRNFMDSICKNCPGNEEKDLSFSVLNQRKFLKINQFIKGLIKGKQQMR